jgi:hypothetical protein
MTKKSLSERDICTKFITPAVVQAGWDVASHEEHVPRATRRWPHPGGMLKQVRSSERKVFLQYLSDWFYGPLSSSTHLSAPGLGTSAALLLAREHLDDYEARLEKFKSDQVFMALTLLLAIVSELQIELGLSLAERLGYLWVIISKYAWGADDLYAKRYQQRLGFGVSPEGEAV